MKRFVFVPAGGLGNRMKGIAAAIRLAHEGQRSLTMIWFQDWGLGCRFDQLFEPICSDGVTLREPGPADYLLYDRPRRKNLHVPGLMQRLLFDRRMGEEEATKRMEEGFDFGAWAKDHDVWMSSHVYFMSNDIPVDAFDIFRPIGSLRERVKERLMQCGNDVVGVHIRRTDNERSVRESPTEAFIAEMEKEPATTRFYLATDDEGEKQRLRAAFPGRVVTQAAPADRGSVSGMQDALVEMYTLAGCRKILGSSCSTFSMTAASIGRAPLVIVKKQ